MKTWPKYLPLLLLGSCSPVADDRTNPPKESIATRQELKDDETAKVEKVKMYTLPSPLQIASSLKNGAYHIQRPEETGRRSNGYLSPDQLALNLGLKTVELGAAAIYQQDDRLPTLAKDIIELSDQLDLSFQRKRQFADRLAKNTNDRDSLYHMVLDIYRLGQQELIQQGKERTGAYIIVGCYLGGLQMTLSAEGNTAKAHDKLIGHQKVYLKSIIKMMESIPGDDVFSGVIKQLHNLNHTFEGVDLNFKHPSIKPFKVRRPVTNEVKDSLLRHTQMILSGVSGVPS